MTEADAINVARQLKKIVPKESGVVIELYDRTVDGLPNANLEEDEEFAVSIYRDDSDDVVMIFDAL